MCNLEHELHEEGCLDPTSTIGVCIYISSSLFIYLFDRSKLGYCFNKSSVISINHIMTHFYQIMCYNSRSTKFSIYFCLRCNILTFIERIWFILAFKFCVHPLTITWIFVFGSDSIAVLSILLTLCGSWQQVLREFNHVNPQDDEEGKVFSDTRVSDLMHYPIYCILLVIFLTGEAYLPNLWLVDWSQFILNLSVSPFLMIEEFVTLECCCMLSKAGRMQKVHWDL